MSLFVPANAPLSRAVMMPLMAQSAPASQEHARPYVQRHACNHSHLHHSLTPPPPARLFPSRAGFPPHAHVMDVMEIHSLLLQTVSHMVQEGKRRHRGRAALRISLGQDQLTREPNGC